MQIYHNLISRQTNLAVIGLGYVGMPLAVAFSKTVPVIGFDLDSDKIQNYINGIDPTHEVGNEQLKMSNILYTSNDEDLKDISFFIIAVPTPINPDKTPDLNPVIKASEIVGRHLSKNSIVVYESTVYPGVTEEICIPILEQASHLICGKDFKVGYSPERINPGDRFHRLENIKKIVSGQDSDALEQIAEVYKLIIKAGVHKVSSIRTAEAAKVVENSQRDINIAFMNELAMVFDRMNIDTREVIEAMNTKWNSLGFYPGLVGGHCISVDPYYFIYEAEKLGFHSQIILAGRKINDGMGKYIAEAAIKELILGNKKVKTSKVLILGITFKENCPDIRNSKVIDIITTLYEYGITAQIYDPYANAAKVKSEYGLELLSSLEGIKVDCIILAVAHQKFQEMSILELDNLYLKDDTSSKILIDVKSILDKQIMLEKGYQYWRL